MRVAGDVSSSDGPFYPPGPARVPADFMVPSRAYRRHAYLALACLLGFVAAYVAFGACLARTALRLLSAAITGPEVHGWPLLVGASIALLAVFLFKALFFVQRGRETSQRELSATEHPRLFAFLHRLADEARAPRPHRVFVSSEVNAGVFYDLSLLNLIVPSRKNLVIGLGLVNALTLSEFKAVLAYTMAIGRWVYIARQVTIQIVDRRDALDRALVGLSTVGVRLAWIGWLLRLIIWAIRAVADSMFRVVLAAERALGRQMERHADLVAVSLAGSDAPVHALHRLDAADWAMNRALAFLESEGVKGHAVIDLLAIQRRVIERMRTILDDPLYGDVPPVPANPERHRLFRARLAHPPKMWTTHPRNEEREELAKQRYLSTPLDDRSPWLLFEHPQRLREEVTAALYIEGKRPPVAPLPDSLARLDDEFGKPLLDPRYRDPRYRGVYLARSAFRHAERPDQLYDGDADGDAAQLDALYPTSLREVVARRRELAEELALAEAVQVGRLRAAGGVIRHRGQEHRRRELPALIARTRGDLDEVERELAAHDRRCRSVHLAAARRCGEGWAPVLRGLVELSHYATHREADLDDAIGALGNVISVVTADGLVSDRERKRVMGVAADLHQVLRGIHVGAQQVELGPAVAARLGCDSWFAKLGGELGLSAPDEANLGNWLGAVDSWAGRASMELAVLRNAALAELLSLEQVVATAARDGTTPPAPPGPPPAVNLKARWFPPSAERPRQTRLAWWDRIMVADGYLPSTVRLAMTGSVIGAVMWAGNAIDRAVHAPDLPTQEQGVVSRVTVSVDLYNGLDRAVKVDLGGMKVSLQAATAQHLRVPLRPAITITTTTDDDQVVGQLIDQLTPELHEGTRYVYSVAGSTFFYQWLTEDGHLVGPPQFANASRWFTTTTALRLQDGLELVPARRARLILLGPSRFEDAAETATLLAPANALVDPALAHARWDRADSPALLRWLTLAATVAPTKARPLVAARLEERPGDLALRELAVTLDAEHQCAEVTAAVAAPAPPAAVADRAYLAALCARASDGQLLALARRWPEHPHLARRAGLALARKLKLAEALPLLEHAHRALPASDLAEPLARVRRAVAAQRGEEPEAQAGDLLELLASSRQLRSLSGALAAEDRPPAPVEAVELLRQGRLDDAAQAAGRDGVTGEILPLLAASDGAAPELPARVLDESWQTAGAAQAAAQLGLALRAQRDGAPYLERLLAATGEDAAALRPFLDQLARRKVPPITLLAGASLPAQGLALSTAVIALGPRCPAPWRKLAKGLLLPAERPYFR